MICQIARIWLQCWLPIVKTTQPMIDNLKTIVIGTLNSKSLPIPWKISTELHPSRLDVIRKLIHQVTETINLIAGGIAKKSVIPWTIANLKVSFSIVD